MFCGPCPSVSLSSHPSLVMPPGHGGWCRFPQPATAPLGTLVVFGDTDNLQHMSLGNSFGGNCDFRGSRPQFPVSWEASKGSESVELHWSLALRWEWPQPSPGGQQSLCSHTQSGLPGRWGWSRVLGRGPKGCWRPVLSHCSRATPQRFPVLGGSDPPSQPPEAPSLAKLCPKQGRF